MDRQPQHKKPLSYASAPRDPGKVMRAFLECMAIGAALELVVLIIGVMTIDTFPMSPTAGDLLLLLEGVLGAVVLYVAVRWRQFGYLVGVVAMPGICLLILYGFIACMWLFGH